MNPLSPKLFFCLASVIFFFCFCNTGDSNKCSWSFRPKKGKVYHLSLTRLQTTLRSAYGAYSASSVCDTLTMNAELKNEFQIDSSIVMSCKFLHVEEKQTPSRYKKIEGKGGFSVSPEDMLEKRREVFYLLEGMTATVTFNRRGAVEDVTGTEQMTDSLSAMLKVPPSSIGVLTEELFSKEAIRFLFNEIFFNVPVTEKHKGDRWGDDIYLDTKLPVKYSRLLTMKDETAGHYTFGIQSLLSAHAGEGGKIYLRGNQNGSAVIEKDTGLPAEYETSTVSVTKTDYYAVTEKETLTVTIASKE